MNFSLEIRDPSRLVVICDPGCEGAVQLVGSTDSAAAEVLPGGVVCARLSRDPTDGRRLLLRLGCHGAAPPPVSAIDNGRLSTEEQAEDKEVAAVAAEAAASESDDSCEAAEEAQRASKASSSEAADSSPSASIFASALEEFVATERTYVRRLALVFDVYYPGLRSAVQARQLGCSTVEDLKRVFGHFQGMRLLHEQLLADLVQSGQLGKLMAQYAHQLKSYASYYSMFPQITGTVRGWMTDEAFRRVFDQLRRSQASGDPTESQLDLRALLLEPVQRPMRYPMLLDRYLSEIGSCHPDWRNASRAANTVREVLAELEKSLRDFAAFQERLQLLRSVAFPANLAAHWEEFGHSCLKHGRARQGDKQSYLLLSKHTLLLCSASRFRQEAWTAKRALPVPGDLRVLGCEANRLRMDTPRDPQLQLEFGAEEGDGGGSGGGDLGVRECRDWAMELRRLGVPFLDSPAEGDDRLMPWERAAGRTGRPVMTPLDKAPRCQACGAAFRPLQRRRLSCRVCGGAFCSDCADYQASTSWGGDRPLRCCLFCRVAAGGAGPAELASDRHRELLARFRAARELDADPASLTGRLTAWLTGRWVQVWCRLDPGAGRLSLCRHRRDFLPVLALEQPRLRGAAAAADVADDGAEAAATVAADGGVVELVVHEHHQQRRRECRLRGLSGGDGNDGFLTRLADRLGQCAEADGVDCTDGGPQTLTMSPTPTPPASPSQTLTEDGDQRDQLELLPKPW